MTYYTIDIKDYSLTPNVKSSEEFIRLRKANLKITNVFWLVTGVEIDPTYDDCTYHYHTPVLIFLN
jgi:hypothetical protein